LYLSLRTMMAQAIRAILLASATADASEAVVRSLCCVLGVPMRRRDFKIRGGFQETVGRKSGDSEKKRGHRDGVGTVAPATDLCCLVGSYR
jgi:hypothetical protein